MEEEEDQTSEEGSGAALASVRSNLQHQRYRKEYLQLAKECLLVRKMGPKILTQQESIDMFASSESSDSDPEWPYNVRAMTWVQQQQVGVTMNNVINTLVEEQTSPQTSPELVPPEPRRDESDSEASHASSEYRRYLREGETDSVRQFHQSLRDIIRETFGLDSSHSSSVSVSMLDERFNQQSEESEDSVQVLSSESEGEVEAEELLLELEAEVEADQRRRDGPEPLKPFRCPEHNFSEVLVFNNLGKWLVEDMNQEPFFTCVVLEKNCPCRLPTYDSHYHLLVMTTIKSEDPNEDNSLEDLLLSLKLRYFYENELWQTNNGISYSQFHHELNKKTNPMAEQSEAVSQISSETMLQLQKFLKDEEAAPSRTYMLHKQIRSGENLFTTLATRYLWRLIIS